MQQNIISLENVPQQSSCSDIQCVKLSSFFPAFIPRSHTDFLLLFFHYLGRANQVTQSSAPTLQSLISSNQCINNLWSYYFFLLFLYSINYIQQNRPFAVRFHFKKQTTWYTPVPLFQIQEGKKKKTKQKRSKRRVSESGVCSVSRFFIWLQMQFICCWWAKVFRSRPCVSLPICFVFLSFFSDSEWVRWHAHAKSRKSNVVLL